MRAQVLVLSALVAAIPSVAGAATLTNPLTADQVTCDELQLERLALRGGVIEPSPFDFGHPSLFLWHSSAGGGAYSALAVEDGIRGGETGFPLIRSETQLAFDLSFHSAADILNPARALLPQVTVVRREMDSNLIAPGDTTPNLVVLFGLEPRVLDPLQPIIPVEINNLTAASASNQPVAYANGAGRGIETDALTSSCGSALTPFDQRVFTILSRTVRMAQCALLGGVRFCNPDGSAYNVTLFRAADPQTYRANVYFYAEACSDANVCSFSVDKVAYQFTFTWDSNGNLNTGVVTVLPACPSSVLAPGCSDPNGNRTPMFILPPLWPGHGHQGPRQFSLGTLVWDDGPGSTNNVLSAPINWQTLLAGSAWQ
jgi:hypothetical protein